MTTKKPPTKKPVPSATEATPVTPQILPHGSIKPTLAPPFVDIAPFVKKKPVWA
jgi:hypothetical protein